MTKFKQGDRVVPGVEQAYNLIKDATDTLMDLRIKAEKSSVNETELYAVQMKLFQAMDNLSLTPASPKWEPKVGEEINFMAHSCKSSDLNFNDSESAICQYKFTTKDGLHVGEHLDGSLVIARKIRPIAPSPEEELRHKILESVGHASVCWGEAPERIFDEKEAHRCADDLFQFVMQWHNRHKEGEGR